jgi:hypothetical protein
MLKNGLWFLFFLLLAVSCLEEPDCFSLNNNVVRISFRKLSDSSADTVFMSSITAAEGTDSVFLESSLLTGVVLPLNYYKTETQFVLQGQSKTYDLGFNYKSQPQFVSADCGERFVLSELTSFSTTFDSVRVIQNSPGKTTSGGTNIEVYRCPNRSTVKIAFDEPVEIATVQLDGYTGDVLFSAEALTTLKLPLNTAANQSRILITNSEGVMKEITFGYSIATETLFGTCGPQVVLSELELLNSTFTATSEIGNSTIQDPPRTSLEITF